MKLFYRYILLVFLLLGGWSVRAQTLVGLCDSIFEALRYEEFDSLKQFIPSYKQLKVMYDSLDMERQPQQILIAQQRAEYSLKQSFKSFKKQAKQIKMPLKKMEKGEMRHLVQTYEGKKYSNVEVDCQYKNRGATLFYTVIELNNAWYLGEDIRMMEREVEVTPDYDKIDKALERRQEKREQERIKAKEQTKRDSAKAIQERILASEKAARDSLKQERLKDKERLKAERDSAKAAKKQLILDRKKDREEEKKRKAEERNKKNQAAPPPSPPDKKQTKDSLKQE